MNIDENIMKCKTIEENNNLKIQKYWQKINKSIKFQCQ